MNLSTTANEHFQNVAPFIPSVHGFFESQRGMVSDFLGLTFGGYSKYALW